jgi:hypothetical protein
VPAKYSIHTKPIAPRWRPIGKLGIVDWRDDCSSCHNCVKRGCVYGLYRDEYDALRDEIGYLDYIYQCKGCLSCIQNCTKNILTRVVNPEYKRLGDEYFTPDIILSTWYQAESGRIPVSGSGYGGPFSGEGFDAMWTDMSEIVRPTRDGIHGREYISTSVDIGRKLPHLAFQDGKLTVEPLPLAEVAMPVIFDCIEPHWQRGPVNAAVVEAAAELGILAVVRAEDGAAQLAAEHGHVIPLVASAEAAAVQGLSSASIVMIPDGENVLKLQEALKKQNDQRIVAIRMDVTPASAERVVQLTRDGAEVIHLVFDAHGREKVTGANGRSPTSHSTSPHPDPLPEGEGGLSSNGASPHPRAPRSGCLPEGEGEVRSKPRHARDVLREIHRALVKDGTRDRVTLVASGGIALPEHMAKAIICGADLVAIDLPLLVALECRLCGECRQGQPCPIALEETEADYAVNRIHNLLGAWHQQLIEVLGAMGIREVRRLRGETGRAMFFEDLERDTFGRMFGKRKPIAN